MQLVQHIDISGQIRFCIDYKAVYRELMCYFPASADGGVAFQSYFSGNYVSTVELDTNFKDVRIDPEGLEKVSFQGKIKHNYHKSGIVTSKSNSATPFDERVTAARLEAITSATSILFFQPCNLERYPNARPNKTYWNVRGQEVENLPPVFHFIAYKDFSELAEVVERRTCCMVFLDDNIISRHGLSLCTLVYAHNNRKFPPAEVVGVFRYGLV